MVPTLLRKRRDFVPRNNGWPFIAQSQGSIWVDKGAAEALSQHGKSLLLSGIVDAEGAFSYGDIVTVFDKESGNHLEKDACNLVHLLWRICCVLKKPRVS